MIDRLALPEDFGAEDDGTPGEALGHDHDHDHGAGAFLIGTGLDGWLDRILADRESGNVPF